MLLLGLRIFGPTNSPQLRPIYNSSQADGSWAYRRLGRSCRLSWVVKPTALLGFPRPCSMAERVLSTSPGLFIVQAHGTVTSRPPLFWFKNESVSAIFKVRGHLGESDNWVPVWGSDMMVRCGTSCRFIVVVAVNVVVHERPALLPARRRQHEIIVLVPSCWKCVPAHRPQVWLYRRRYRLQRPDG